MAVHLNDESQNDLLDNILCYIAGFIVKNIMKVVQCTNCHEEMLIHRDDPHGYSGISIRKDHLFSLHYTERWDNNPVICSTEDYQKK